MFLHVVISINGSELHRYSFSDTEILIGRSSECQVLLDNAGVSRTHAKVLRQGNRVQIVDLGSGNGTFLNGEKVDEALVNSGDTVGIGKFSLTLKVAEEALEDADPHPEAEPEPVSSNTVFLRPEETRKILETQVASAQPHTSTPVRPNQVDAEKPTSLWLIIAGALAGLVLGWLIWGG